MKADGFAKYIYLYFSNRKKLLSFHIWVLSTQIFAYALDSLARVTRWAKQDNSHENSDHSFMSWTAALLWRILFKNFSSQPWSTTIKMIENPSQQVIKAWNKTPSVWTSLPPHISFAFNAPTRFHSFLNHTIACIIYEHYKWKVNWSHVEFHFKVHDPICYKTNSIIDSK